MVREGGENEEEKNSRRLIITIILLLLILKYIYFFVQFLCILSLLSPHQLLTHFNSCTFFLTLLFSHIFFPRGKKNSSLPSCPQAFVLIPFIIL